MSVPVAYHRMIRPCLSRRGVVAEVEPPVLPIIASYAPLVFEWHPAGQRLTVRSRRSGVVHNSLDPCGERLAFTVNYSSWELRSRRRRWAKEWSAKFEWASSSSG